MISSLLLLASELAWTCPYYGLMSLRFLESQGFKEEALTVSTDPDQKFDLAVQLNRLDIAHQIMSKEIGDSDTTNVQVRAHGSPAAFVPD